MLQPNRGMSRNCRLSAIFLSSLKKLAARENRGPLRFEIEELLYCVVAGCTPAVFVGNVGLATKKLWS